jgi:hypothetical protein
MSRTAIGKHKPVESTVPELELFTGDEQRSGRLPLVRSGPVRSGITTPPSVPSPVAPRGSLRQNGVVVTGRISLEDAAWLKASGFGVGEILREWVRVHRFDPEILKLRSETRKLELELAHSSIAANLGLRHLERREQRRENLERVQAALDQVRPAFRSYSANVTTYEHRLSWIRSRTRKIAELRRIPAEDLLDELLAQPMKSHA